MAAKLRLRAKVDLIYLMQPRCTHFSMFRFFGHAIASRHHSNECICTTPFAVGAHARVHSRRSAGWVVVLCRTKCPHPTHTPGGWFCVASSSFWQHAAAAVASLVLMSVSVGTLDTTRVKRQHQPNLNLNPTCYASTLFRQKHGHYSTKLGARKHRGMWRGRCVCA